MKDIRRFFRRSRSNAGPGDVRAAGEPAELVLYTRANCPLCDAMKAELERVRPIARRPFRVREVDIAGDPELEERFGRSIPVLEIAGRPAFKGRLTADELERKLEARLGESG